MGMWDGANVVVWPLSGTAFTKLHFIVVYKIEYNLKKSFHISTHLDSMDSIKQENTVFLHPFLQKNDPLLNSFMLSFHVNWP